MKDLFSIPKLKITLIISVMVFSIFSFYSCEKTEDVEPASSQEVNLVTQSEVVVVEKDNWFYSRTNFETTLETTLLPHRGGYGCVEVFIKNEKVGSNSIAWEPLPNQTTRFQIRDGRICILNPTSWIPVRSSYLVKVNLRSGCTSICQKADLSPKATQIQ